MYTPEADLNGDGEVTQEEAEKYYEGDMDLSGDPEQEMSPEVLKMMAAAIKQSK